VALVTSTVETGYRTQDCTHDADAHRDCCRDPKGQASRALKVSDVVIRPAPFPKDEVLFDQDDAINGEPILNSD